MASFFRSFRRRRVAGTELLYPVITDGSYNVLFSGILLSNHLGKVIRATNDLNDCYKEHSF